MTRIVAGRDQQKRVWGRGSYAGRRRASRFFGPLLGTAQPQNSFIEG